jgi:molybdenum cofactor biosynthesis enzyme MoaA/polysaccharide pyruvyl transferase WcaK-like protein
LTLLTAFGDIFTAYQRRPLGLEKPRVIQFPVNDICNARCEMCHIWEQKLGDQITPEQLLDALDNPLYSEVRSVGINGGEPTLRRDLPELVDALYRRLPRLRTVSLITNGLVARRVTASIEAVGEAVHRHRGWLDVMVSLDGVGPVHDTVRGREGNFANVEKVIDYLKQSTAADSSQLACTVVRDNVYGLHDLLDWTIARDMYIKFRLAVPHGRLYTEDVHEPFALTDAENHHFAVFLENLIQHYEQSPQQRFFYRSLVDQLMYQAPRKAGCNWQHRGVTLTSRGELLYCAVRSDVLGSTIESDSTALYRDNVGHLQQILRDDCADCRHDYGGLPPGREYLRQSAIEAGRRIGIDIDGFLRGERLPGLARAASRLALRMRIRQRGLTGPVPAPARQLPARPRDRVRRVMICGWYGTETLGDKAILAGVMAALRAALGDCEFSLASLEGYISRRTLAEMPELQPLELMNMSAALDKVVETDLLVFGGGPLMAVNAMLDMLGLFRAAAKAGVPTVVAGCGVGPLGGPVHTDLVRRLLACSSLRIFRDTQSRDRALALGVGQPDDAVAEDPAAGWVRRARTLASSAEANGPVLLLALRDWPVEQYAAGPRREALARKQRFERALLLVLERLAGSQDDLRFIPFPMCTHHHGGDDRWFYRRFLRQSPGLLERCERHYLTHEVTPDEACAAFRRADAVLGMRFHSVLIAAELGRPVLALDYTLGAGKVAALADRRQLPVMSLGDLEVDRACQQLLPWLQRREPDRPLETGASFAEALAAGLATLQPDGDGPA